MMDQISSLVALLCFFIFICLQSDATFVSQQWARIRISAATLTTANLSEVVQTTSIIACTLLAFSRNWVHLICFKDTKCQLFDLLALVTHDDNTPDAEVCYTNLFDACLVGNKIIPKGDNATIDCEEMVCEGGVMVPAYKGCPSGFMWVYQVGCLHVIEEETTYDDAVDHCNTLLGSKLVVPEDFGALQAFIKCLPEPATQYHRVGIRGRKWLDGRDVVTGEWYPTEPNEGIDECAYILSNDQMLRDYYCTYLTFSICQLQ